MSNARNLANLLGTGTQVTTADIADGVFQANKNLIINGAQLINQRGDATGRSGSGYYSTDRFRLLINLMGGYDISQSSTAPDGFSKSKRFYCSTADASPGASDYLIMQHAIEGYNLQHLDWGSASAKKITLSFWVKSSKTGTYNVEFSQDAANPPYKSLQYTVSVADTWEYKTLTFSGNTTDPLTDGTVASLNIYWWLGAGSTFTSGTYNADTWHGTNGNRAVGNVNLSDTVGNNWNITGVQLEVGEQATPFEHRSYGDELARCQRYYERYSGWTEAEATLLLSGRILSSNRNDACYFFRTKKRAAPSLTMISDNGSGGTSPSIVVFPSNATSETLSFISAAISGANTCSAIIRTTGGATLTNGHNSTTMMATDFAFDAEL